MMIRAVYSYFFLLIFIFDLSLLLSQPSQLSFNNVARDESWGNNTFNDIVQDEDGFIWFATWSGLIKFDGINSTVYGFSTTQKEGLKGNKITCLLTDSKNRLWIGTTYSGFYKYDPEHDTFIQYASRDSSKGNSLIHDNVWAITED
ncbi:MAG: two-component regulator propeller domain-containing protein, partial [Bacteroidota bacterium]